MAKSRKIPLQEIIGAFKSETNKVLNAILPQIKQDLDNYLGGAIRRAMLENETIKALSNYSDPLRGELGLQRRRQDLKGEVLVNSIVDYLINNTESKITKQGVRSSNPSVNHKINLNITGILREKFATYTYLRLIKEKNKPPRYIKQKIHWLKWLLEDGNSIIVKGHKVYGTRPNVYGRSGLRYLMSRRGNGWRVPPQHAGTPRNNFITRAMLDYSDVMIKEMRAILRGSIKQAAKVAQKQARATKKRRRR